MRILFVISTRTTFVVVSEREERRTENYVSGNTWKEEREPTPEGLPHLFWYKCVPVFGLHQYQGGPDPLESREKGDRILLSREDCGRTRP